MKTDDGLRGGAHPYIFRRKRDAFGYVDHGLGDRMTKIRWKRSDEGFVESHCGEWCIVPRYWGCVRCYDLIFASRRVGMRYETQSDAKQAAHDLRVRWDAVKGPK